MKHKLTTGIFLGILFTFFFLHLFLPDKEISLSERRHLTQISMPSVQTLLNGNWMENFESYSLDQFPGRDSFRSLKAHTIFHGLHYLDNNQLFIKDKHIVKMEYPLNPSSLKYFTRKLDSIQKTYLKNNRVYGAWIPDKNFFINDHHLRMDYDFLQNQLTESLPNMTWIPLSDTLTLNDYYHSDIHWKQENLFPVVSRLSDTMGFSINDFPSISHEYTPFYGGYYGQAALPFKSETLTYLTSPIIDQCQVWNFEKNQWQTVYSPQLLTGMDSYDVFLSGATPLLQIENPTQKNGKELLLFRDSFGSSLAPLLIDGYEKITLIDLRYIPMEMVGDFISFDHQDVLFLYSTTLINNSFSLK